MPSIAGYCGQWGAAADVAGGGGDLGVVAGEIHSRKSGGVAGSMTMLVRMGARLTWQRQHFVIYWNHDTH